MLYLADVHGGKTECALPSIIAILKLWDKHEFSFAREGHTLRWFMREEGLISGISPVKVVMAGEKLSSWSGDGGLGFKEGEIGWNRSSVADLFVGWVSPIH